MASSQSGFTRLDSLLSLFPVVMVDAEMHTLSEETHE